MQHKWLVSLTIVWVLLLPSFSGIPAARAQAFNLGSPLLNDIETKMIVSYDTRILSFEAGDIDAVGVLPKDLERIQKSKPIAELGGEIVRTVTFNTLNMLHFNVRDRIGPVGPPDDPDLSLPYNIASVPEVRKAIAHLLERDKIIFGPLLQGNAIKTTTTVPSVFGDWVNPDKSKVDYEQVFPFSIERANAVLDKAGFSRPAGQKFRVYTVPRADAAGRPYADVGQTKPLEIEVVLLPEAQSPVGFQVFRQYVENGEKVGIAFKPKFVTGPGLSAAVFGTRGFQTFLIGWGLTTFPTFVRSFWHSIQDIWIGKRPEGFNWAGVRSAALDKVLDEFQFTLDLEEAKRANWRAQELLMDIVPWIPTYTGVGFTAISGNFKGRVLNFAPPAPDSVGFSLLTDYNLQPLEARTRNPIVGGKFRDASNIIIGTLNPMNYLWVDEAAIIQRMMEFPTLFNPEDIFKKPRLAVLLESWSSEAVLVDGKNGTKITFRLKEGLRWHDGRPLTAFDYEWTILNPGVKWKTLRFFGQEAVKNLVRVEAPDSRTVIFFLGARSWTFVGDMLAYRPLPRHLLSRVTDPFADLSRTPHPERADLTLLVGTGGWILTRHDSGRAVSVTWNPEYHVPNPAKQLRLDVKLPGTLEEGSTATVEVRVTDFLGNPVPDAEVSITLTGPLTTTLLASHVSGGTYTRALTGAVTGNFQVEVSAKKAIPYGALRGTTTLALNVFPKGLPPPPPAAKIEEKAPTSITLPSVPSLPAAPSVPEARVETVSAVPQILQLVAAVIVVALGIVAARKRT